MKKLSPNRRAVLANYRRELLRNKGGWVALAGGERLGLTSARIWCNVWWGLAVGNLMG